MELFEQIRREHEFGGGSIRGLARNLGVHRRLVRQALSSALPPPRQPTQRPCLKLAPAKAFIDEILEADRQAPRKQRHTAHRIYVRLRQEQPQWPLAESTVRGYVRRRKQEMGLLERTTWVPQCYGWGEEAQVDWYEAYADLGEEEEKVRVKVQVFNLRSMASGAAFHRAYHRATQQALLEAHELAFAYFGGVFGTLRYDNLTTAVKKILRGYQREEHTRFIAFRSHWRFEAAFCAPAQPQEKGGVEGEVSYFRHNHFVPVPQARDLADLNRQLLEGCRQDQARLVGERSQSVGEGMMQEQGYLQPLAEEGFDLAEVRFGSVDGKGCVKVSTNCYSTPLAAGSKVRVRVLPATVEVWQGAGMVASHEHCYGRGQQILELEHYLDVLERKPGALARSKPLAQWREQGRWPASFDQMWQKLQQRHGQAAGTRAMIELLQLGSKHGYPALRGAIEAALEMGCSDAAAVRYLLTVQQAMTQQAVAASTKNGHAGNGHLIEAQSAAPPLASAAPPLASAAPPLALDDLGRLVRYERPLPEVNSYDQLLGRAAVVPAVVSAATAVAIAVAEEVAP